MHGNIVISKEAAKLFDRFGERFGGGLREVLTTIRAYMENTEIIGSALYTINGALAAFKDTAGRLRNIDGGVACLMDVGWMHLEDSDLRLRCLWALRSVHQALPLLTEEMSIKWERKLTEYMKRARGDVEEAAPQPAQPRSDTEEMQGEETVFWDPSETENIIPRDTLQFGALLRVHRFSRSNGGIDLRFVLGPLQVFWTCKEIAELGLQALMTGTKEELQERCQAIKDVPEFGSIIRNIATYMPSPEVAILAMRLCNGVLQHLPANSDAVPEYASVSVTSTIAVIEKTKEWNGADWQAVLNTLLVVGKTEFGRTLLHQEDVPGRVMDEWKYLKQSEDGDARVIVKTLKEETETAINILEEPLE